MKHPLLVFVFILTCVRAAGAGPAAECAQVRNDDTIHPYDRSVRAGLLNAYALLFPHARMPPDDRVFRSGAHIRCMDGRLLACFTGANLPCAKLKTERANPGATEFCRTNPDATFVPAFATGHDSAHTYRCVAGHASISGETFPLDQRGFAATLWAPID